MEKTERMKENLNFSERHNLNLCNNLEPYICILLGRNNIYLYLESKRNTYIYQYNTQSPHKLINCTFIQFDQLYVVSAEKKWSIIEIPQFQFVQWNITEHYETCWNKLFQHELGISNDDIVMCFHILWSFL